MWLRIVGKHTLDLFLLPHRRQATKECNANILGQQDKLGQAIKNIIKYLDFS